MNILISYMSASISFTYFLQQFPLNIFNHSIYYYQRIGEVGILFLYFIIRDQVGT